MILNKGICGSTNSPGKKEEDSANRLQISGVGDRAVAGPEFREGGAFHFNDVMMFSTSRLKRLHKRKHEL
jgi:hypothetical protein